MMLERTVKASVEKALQLFPAVCLIGPRQCGKTTLAKTFSNRYYDLERPEDQNKLLFEIDTLESTQELVIFDEAQEWPDLFKQLRGIIDRDRKRNGRFLILGSVSPSIMKLVSESLAGRLHIVELSPFNLAEIGDVSADTLWLKGGFPDGGILTEATFPAWQKSYLDLLIKRDLPLWGLPAKPQTTLRLLKMLAASAGNLVNHSQLGNALGLSHTTVRNYCEYLEGAFLVFFLKPYAANIPKRLVKMPKVFFHDTGLLHVLLETYSYEQLLYQPWLGNSWENFCIQQMLSHCRQKELPLEPYFFRTSDGSEIDLILNGEAPMAIEIKTSTTISPQEVDRLQKLATTIGIQDCTFIYRGKEALIRDNLRIMPLRAFLDLLSKK